MKKNLFILSFLSLLLIFASCEKNGNEVSNPLAKTNPEDLYAKTEYNLDMRDFAMAVSEAVNTNKSFRKLVKEEAMKMFDGDYDVLLSNIVERQVDTNECNNDINAPNRIVSNSTVRDLFENAFHTLNEKNKLESVRAKQMIKSSNSRQNISAVQSTLIDELIEEYPNLQISVPVHIEDLEDPNYFPPIAFIPEEYDEDKTLFVPAYKEDEMYELNTQEIPESAVIVVGMNERIDIIEDISIEEPAAILKVSSTGLQDGISLTWTVPAPHAPILGFKVLRGTSSDNLEELNTRTSYNAFYHDANIVSGTTYYYAVIVIYSGEVESDISNIGFAVAPSSTAEPLTFTANVITNTYAELTWTLDPTKYIEKTELYKQNIGIPAYNLVDIFNKNTTTYFDTNILPGNKYKYQLKNFTTNGGFSNSKTDFIYVPYRNPASLSPVRIKKVKWNDSWSLEGPFLQGAPEFYIKVLKVNKSDKKTFEVQDEIKVNIPTIYREWGREEMDCDIYVFDWEPDDSWYDMLTFYAIEADNSSLKMNFSAGYNVKDTTLTKLGFNGGVSAEYTFSNDGDKIGYGYLNYYQPIDTWIEFPNHGFKILVGQ